ncbi:traB domain-containing protein-like [Papaver somniferum]|uniref:traB domain-containing protein-like n=1 Tax=Papaver somniferum TaxID=3469 RepID=UPI000E6F4FA5|nr:traB domain-containing protein-like [Papaver somniferum]
MIFICNYLFRGFITNLRSIFHRRPSSSAQLETSHYQHGIPGIPTDGKVVLLKNSSNGALLYLIGTVHGSVQGAETVKEVIDYVRPDVVAVELCKERAMAIMEWKPEDDTSLYMLFRRSMRAAGGLCMKFVIFIESCRERRSHANGIFPGLEFKVAIEESSRVGARCFYIDQDMDVTLQQLCKVSTFYWLWSAYSTGVRGEVKYTRSFVQEMHSFQKELSPEIFKAMIEDRDKFMFTNLRSFQGKVVAAVGMGHMDGIELLWKQEEEDDNSSVFITVIEGGHGHSE